MSQQGRLPPAAQQEKTPLTKDALCRLGVHEFDDPDTSQPPPLEDPVIKCLKVEPVLFSSNN
jgi:hypothetical protein